jgi:hypothetical protein
MQEKAGALATLFKTVLTFNLPLNHEDILLNDGAVATFKSHALRIWCLEMTPKVTPARYCSPRHSTNPMNVASNVCQAHCPPRHRHAFGTLFS